ncbi:MAG: energy-coupling factor transporter transmembrane component T [Candidatus Cloacimonadaceae bacterium]
MIHPLSRLIIVLCISTIAILYNNLLVLTWLLLACLILLTGKKQLDWRRIVRFFRYFLPLLLSIFIIQIIFNNKGEILLDLQLFKVTEIGLNTSGIVTIRLLILFLAGVWLWGLSHREFNQAFRAIGLPESLAVLISLTLHFLPLLAERIKQMTTQLKLRGISLKGMRLKPRLQLYLNMIIPLLGWTMKDLKYQAIALDLRGFRNGTRHSQYRLKRLNLLDYLLILTALLCLWLPRLL